MEQIFNAIDTMNGWFFLMALISWFAGSYFLFRKIDKRRMGK